MGRGGLLLSCFAASTQIVGYAYESRTVDPLGQSNSHDMLGRMDHDGAHLTAIRRFSPNSLDSCLWNCLTSFCALYPVTLAIGSVQGAVLLLGGGIMGRYSENLSGMVQSDPKVDATFHYANGPFCCVATAAICSSFNQLAFPSWGFSTRLIAPAMSFAFLVKCFRDEYGEHRGAERTSGAAGGVCFALIHNALFVTARKNMELSRKLFSTL